MSGREKIPGYFEEEIRRSRRTGRGGTPNLPYKTGRSGILAGLGLAWTQHLPE